MPLPLMQVAGIGGGFEPTHFRVAAFGTGHQIQAVFAIDLQRQAEHPTLRFFGNGDGFGLPSMWESDIDLCPAEPNG